ncbi:CbiM family transporter [Dethiobacter alkaliphilus]|uniref:CbiM family transporter n=1 Tax=Dethiobacter alkaliphilus TaxID=427926 RepID=UPI002226970D|nr:CbiM family transporter [Dethiobacter alkaliphilus]MCW3489419.1 CbiM family transporter [Dethiobacter alkaliphilus]
MVYMHITDGVVSLPVAGAAAAAAGVSLVYAVKNTKEEEIPRLSLLSGAFFVFSLISVPVGPTSVHPLLAGLLGIMLGVKAPIAIFIGLLLQALLFNHGGLTTLGVNLILVAVPALIAGKLFYVLKRLSVFTRAALVGGIGVMACVLLLVLLLLITDQLFADGRFSVVNILLIGYTPLMIVEAVVTGFAINFLYRSRPGLLGLADNKAQAG